LPCGLSHSLISVAGFGTSAASFGGVNSEMRIVPSRVISTLAVIPAARAALNARATSVCLNAHGAWLIGFSLKVVPPP
jgi:hypothetical protein